MASPLYELLSYLRNSESLAISIQYEMTINFNVYVHSARQKFYENIEIGNLIQKTEKEKNAPAIKSL